MSDGISGSALIEVRNLGKQYELASERLGVLQGVDFTAEAGKMIVIMGPSGSGKTTFVSLLETMDADYTGSIRIEGEELRELSPEQRAEFRSIKVGMIFQDYGLLPQLTAVENVEAPLFLRRMPNKDRRARARDAMQLVRMADRERHRPNQLSGGERQRTAIARALVTGAQIIICDEPTGNLNREMSAEIFALLKRLCHDFGKCVILTTHDHAATAYADAVYELTNGRLLAASSDAGS